MFLFCRIHQVVHYYQDLLYDGNFKEIFVFVAPGCPEPPVPVISTTSSLEPAATVPSPTPFPPEPSTPYVASSATVSLEEASIQAEKTCSVETPGPLFNPGANSTMLRYI